MDQFEADGAGAGRHVDRELNPSGVPHAVLVAGVRGIRLVDTGRIDTVKTH